MHRIRCSEIWGGTAARDEDLCTAGVCFSLFSKPAQGDHGGDIYYVSVCGGDRLTRVAIADVAGHGETVAGVSAWMYEALEGHMNEPDGARILADLNDAAFEHGLDAMTTAVVVGHYIDTGRFAVSYAGHPSIVVQRGKAQWESRPAGASKVGPSHLPLGVLAETSFTEMEIALESGDRFLLYTDGVIEIRDAAGEIFGEERLVALLDESGDAPLAEVKRSIVQVLLDFGDGNLHHDDVTLVLGEVGVAQRASGEPASSSN